MDAAVLDKPVIKKSFGDHLTTPEGDVVGTHNGLRSYVRFHLERISKCRRERPDATELLYKATRKRRT